MFGKTVTLYIDDSGIRLLVTSGKRIKKWADLPFKPGIIDGGIVQKEVEAADSLKKFLREQGVSAKKVNVGLSGLHCLTRPVNLPHLPRLMLPEAVNQEAKRLMPLPLEQLYVNWEIISSVNNRLNVFISALRRSSTDSVLRMLKQAGLSARNLDIKPLAIARLAPKSTAVIVDVQATEFDIIVLSDGVPQPVRTVTFPPESNTWVDKFPLIRDDLDRTIKFFNDNAMGKPLTGDTQIYVSGELAYEPELCQTLSYKLGYEVVPMPLPLKCPLELDPGRYMPNIGLALKEVSPWNKGGHSLVHANLIPEAYKPPPISLVRVVAIPSTIVLIGIIAPLIILIQNASANIEAMQKQIETTNQILVDKNKQKVALKKDITNLEKELEIAKKERLAFTNALNSLSTQRGEVDGDLAVTMTAQPLAIILTDISKSAGVLTISGIAPEDADVLTYARNLEASLRFDRVIISNVEKLEDTRVRFTFNLETRVTDV